MPVQKTEDRQLHWQEIAIVAVVHLALALLATYPLLSHLDSAVAGGGDSVQNIWNLWWVRWAAARGDLVPYHTHMLYHPTGVSLAFHTLGLLNGWMGVLLQAGLGLSLAAAYNVITLATFVASGLAVYLLVRLLVGSPTAAFVASIIFTFAPIRMSRVSFGNLNLYSTQFVPLAVLLAIAMLQTRQRRYAMLAAIALAATTWISLELALGTGLLISLLLLFYIAVNRHELGAQWVEMAKTWGLFGLATLILVFPVILPMILDSSDFRDQSNLLAASDANNADLLSFFVPDSPTQPLITRISPTIAQAVNQIYGRFYGNPSEKTVFVGYIVLSLTALTVLISRSSTMRQWLAVAAVFFVLSLGPVLRVAGQPILDHLPYEWLNRIPLVGFDRTPSRFAIFLMLALAVVAGYGLAKLETTHAKFRLFTPVLGILIFVEFLIVPIRLDARISKIPAYISELSAAEDGRGAILDVPIDLIGAQGPAGNYMLYQIVHERPIVSGYISRSPRDVLWPFERPFLNELRARIYGDTAPYHFSEEALLQAREDLRLLQVGCVVLHKDELSDQDSQTVRTALETVLSTPDFEDDALTVWKVDNTP